MRSGRWQYSKVLAKINSVEAITCCNHFFMNFFTGTNTHNGMLTLWPNGISYIGNPITRNFWNKNLATLGSLQSPQDHIHSVLQANVEAGHRGVCYWQNPSFSLS